MGSIVFQIGICRAQSDKTWAVSRWGGHAGRSTWTSQIQVFQTGSLHLGSAASPWNSWIGWISWLYSPPWHPLPRSSPFPIMVSVRRDAFASRLKGVKMEPAPWYFWKLETSRDNVRLNYRKVLLSYNVMCASKFDVLISVLTGATADWKRLNDMALSCAVKNGIYG